jgi:hypothetical protein
VGTVVKTGEADDPIGVMTVLSLQRYRAKECLGQLRDFLLEKCEGEELQAKLKQVRELGGCRSRARPAERAPRHAGGSARGAARATRRPLNSRRLRSPPSARRSSCA